MSTQENSTPTGAPAEYTKLLGLGGRIELASIRIKQAKELLCILDDHIGKSKDDRSAMLALSDAVFLNLVEAEGLLMDDEGQTGGPAMNGTQS